MFWQKVGNIKVKLKINKNIFIFGPKNNHLNTILKQFLICMKIKCHVLMIFSLTATVVWQINRQADRQWSDIERIQFYFLDGTLKIFLEDFIFTVGNTT